MKKFRGLFVNSFFYCLAIEVVEEMLEELIAWGVSNVLTFVITKFFSAILVFFGTQLIKSVIKRIIKKITYKEGNDKVEKLKSVFKWLYANKCTLGGIVLGGVTAVSGAGVIDVTSFPPLIVGTLNLTPFIYYGVIGVLIAVCAFFPETWEKFQTRIAQAKAEKEQKAIKKEAKKELADEQKLANQTQAQKEKEDAKKQAEELARAEKEKAEKEHRAKVEKAKAEIIAQNNKTNS